MSHVHCFSSSSVVTIGFDATSYTITESTSSVSVSVSMQDGSLARDVVVTVETMDGTATGGTLSHIQTSYMCRCVIHVLSFHPPAPSDYTSVTTMLTFNAGNTNQTVMLPIIDNMVEEVTESFTVSLTTGDSAVILNPSTITVTIEDDDSKLCIVHIYQSFFLCTSYNLYRTALLCLMSTISPSPQW